MTDIHNYEDKYNNLIVIMCYIESKHIIIAAVYRPPDSPATKFKDLIAAMQEKIDELSHNSRVPDMYITSDFNFPKIDWEHGSTTLDESEEILMRFIDSNFLSQIVREPTRSPKILDLVITNKPDYVVETNITTTPYQTTC